MSAPNHNAGTIALHSVLLSIVTVLVALRYFTRLFVIHTRDWDDLLCLMSYLLTIVYSGLQLADISYGLGHHLVDIPRTHLIYTLKLLWISEILYIPLILAVKLTLLVFYHQLFFPDKRMRWLSRVGIAVMTVFYVGIFWGSVFLCRPAEKAFNFELPGTCSSRKYAPYATGVFNVISDFFTLMLPMPFLWSLHMSNGRKLKLSSIFGVGLFACIASIIRMDQTVKYIYTKDTTWTFSILAQWGLLEVDIGLICACAVTLPAFFEKFLFRHTKPLAGKLWSYIVLLRGSSATGYHKSESDSRLANPTQDPASDRNLVATTETTGGRGLLGGGQHARAVCAQGSTARPQDEMDPHQIRLQIDIEQSHETVDVSGR